MWSWVIPKYLSQYVHIRRAEFPAYRRQGIEDAKHDAIVEFGNWKSRCLDASQNYTIRSRLNNALDAPPLAFWTGLSQFIQSCPKLEDIQLGFTSLNITVRRITPGEDLGRKLEEFVVSGSPWPLAGPPILKEFSHTWRCGEDCPDLSFEDEWETEWDQSDHILIRQVEWKIFEAGDFYHVDPMGDWYTEPCDANGHTFYSGQAFNREGYDPQGIHYELYLDYYDDVYEGISIIAVRKRLLQEILQHIPQYAGQMQHHGLFFPPPWDPNIIMRAYFSIFLSA
ncbi:hypothetical protein EAF04_003641 [Stromatinia cepivora]|nr:hypothetical protein EAF04_003641 [Stromatinia cepivora]